MHATIEQTTVECVVHHLAAGREKIQKIVMRKAIKIICSSKCQEQNSYLITEQGNAVC